MKSARAPFVIAILLAGVAAVSVFVYSSSLAQKAEAGTEAVQVYVAAGEIAAGVSLGEAKAGKLLRLETYPADALPANRLESVTEANAEASWDDLLPIPPGGADLPHWQV